MTIDEQLEQLSKALLTVAHARNKGKLIPGYYAVNDKRYYVDLGKFGKWKGWLFFATGSDYKHRKTIAMIRPDGEISERTSQHAREVVAQIMVDPVQAMLDYASITGVCGVCGRKLEDPTSVAIGIGPICLRKLV